MEKEERRRKGGGKGKPNWECGKDQSKDCRRRNWGREQDSNNDMPQIVSLISKKAPVTVQAGWISSALCWRTFEEWSETLIPCLEQLWQGEHRAPCALQGGTMQRGKHVSLAGQPRGSMELCECIYSPTDTGCCQPFQSTSQAAHVWNEGSGSHVTAIGVFSCLIFFLPLFKLYFLILSPVAVVQSISSFAPAWAISAPLLRVLWSVFCILNTPARTRWRYLWLWVEQLVNLLSQWN